MVRRFSGLTFLNAGTVLPTQTPTVLCVDFRAATYAFHDASPNGTFAPLEAAPLPAPAPVPTL
jgi:hypothetical protein